MNQMAVRSVVKSKTLSGDRSLVGLAVPLNHRLGPLSPVDAAAGCGLRTDVHGHTEVFVPECRPWPGLIRTADPPVALPREVSSRQQEEGDVALGLLSARSWLALLEDCNPGASDDRAAYAWLHDRARIDRVHPCAPVGRAVPLAHRVERLHALCAVVCLPDLVDL